MTDEDLATYGRRFRRAHLAVEVVPALGVLVGVWFLTATTIFDLGVALFVYGLYRLPLVYGETRVTLETDLTPDEVRADLFEGWEPLNGLVRGMASEIRATEYGTEFVGSTWGNRWRIEQEVFENADGWIEVRFYDESGYQNAYVAKVIQRGGTTELRYEGLTTDGRASVADLLRNFVEFHYTERAVAAQGYEVVDAKNRFSLRRQSRTESYRSRSSP